MKVIVSLNRAGTEVPLKLKTDNPGGSWLEEEQEYNASKGLNRHGAPTRFGASTGFWNRRVLLPLDVLIKLKGMSGEQKNVRQADLEWLTEHMKQHGRLPYSDDKSKKHYAPFIMVYQDGTPWVNEGNHRIMAAYKLGYKYLPIELQYNGGGEEAKGPLHPREVKIYDADAHHAGYTIEDYAK